jgi:hypothetical protein
LRITKARIMLRANALVFTSHVAPQLVDFYILYFYVADFLAHDPLALLTGLYEKLQNRFLVDIGQTNYARDAVAFEREFQDHLGFLDRQVHPVKRVVACIGEYLVALRALVALAVLALAKLSAFGSNCGRSLGP